MRVDAPSTRPKNEGIERPPIPSSQHQTGVGETLPRYNNYFILMRSQKKLAQEDQVSASNVNNIPFVSTLVV